MIILGRSGVGKAQKLLGRRRTRMTRVPCRNWANWPWSLLTPAIHAQCTRLFQLGGDFGWVTIPVLREGRNEW